MSGPTRHLRAALLVALLGLAGVAQVAAEGAGVKVRRLRVSENRRFLVCEDGRGPR